MDGGPNSVQHLTLNAPLSPILTYVYSQAKGNLLAEGGGGLDQRDHYVFQLPLFSHKVKALCKTKINPNH